jgi:hypothetical protein
MKSDNIWATRRAEIIANATKRDPSHDRNFPMLARGLLPSADGNFVLCFPYVNKEEQQVVFEVVSVRSHTPRIMRVT